MIDKLRIKPLLITVIIVCAAFSALELYLWQTNKVIVVADGKNIVVRPKGKTVGDVLKQAGISIGKEDLVVPKINENFPKRGLIHLTRVTTKEIFIEKELPSENIWEKKYSANLRPIKLIKQLKKTRHSKVKVTYYDEVENTREILSENIITRTLNLLALLNPDGSIENTYNLSDSKKIKMIATAYYPGDPLAWKDGTITRLGNKMQQGIVAVDPRVIPLRTRVYVPGYGYGYAGDTGSAIKGKRIDLGVDNAVEEKHWMHKKVTVYILEKANTW